MDFARAIMYPFDDDEWLKKLGLGVLIGLIPLVGNPFALQGWSLEISQRVKRNDPIPLPDWGEFGDYLRRGFMLWLASLVYQLPTVLFACVVSVVWVLPALGAGDDSGAAVAALGTMAIIIVSCCSCLAVLYAIAASVVYLGGYIRYLDNEELSTFFQFGDNIALVRNNIGDFGQVILYFLLAGLIVGVVSSITAGLGGLLSVPFFSYFWGHLLGQLAVKLRGAGAPAV
ncbi:MAG: DUF4013 domain-containing protein [Anaerolineae bacterium]